MHAKFEKMLQVEIYPSSYTRARFYNIGSADQDSRFAAIDYYAYLRFY